MPWKERHANIVTVRAKMFREETKCLGRVAKTMQEENPVRAPLLFVYRFRPFDRFSSSFIVRDHPLF